MAYKIQKVWPDSTSSIFYHSSKKDAEKEIENHLPIILMTLKDAYHDLQQSGDGRANILGDMERILIEAGDALKFGDNWDAYQYWREFADFWQEHGIPIGLRTEQEYVVLERHDHATP